MSDRKIGIRVLPPDPGRGRSQRYTDGSVVFIPAGSLYEFDICLQAVEVMTDAEGNTIFNPIELDSCRVGLRPYKTDRRMLRVKRQKKGNE